MSKELRTLPKEEIQRIAEKNNWVYPIENPADLNWWQSFLNFLGDTLSKLFSIDVNTKTIEYSIYFIAAAIIIASFYFLFKDRVMPNYIEEGDEASSSDIKYRHIAKRNFADEINAARQAEDHRLTIRLMYLHILQLLDKNSFIKFSIDKTNHDYDYELRGKPIFQKFEAISNLFDYGWYGHYELNNDMLQKAESIYKSVLHGLKK